MHPGILSRRKKVSPYIAWECHGKSKLNNYHNFNQCSLRHQTTVKALGSLESGFSLHLGLNSRGRRFACTGTIFFSKPISALAWTRLLGAGVLPPRHLARQLTSSRSATSLHLSAHYLLRSVPLKQRLVQCTYLKGQADKLFLKCILEQYRPALEILELRHGADGGGIIHRQTSWSESESL